MAHFSREVISKLILTAKFNNIATLIEESLFDEYTLITFQLLLLIS